MNETIKNLIERRSCRIYKKEQVKNSELDLILEAGTYAANGRGKQSAKIVVVQDKETIKKISMLNASINGSTGDPFFGAPTLIIVFADTDMHTYLQDGVLVVGNIMNAAHSIGVGSCYVNRAKEVFNLAEGKELMKKWGLSDNYEGIANCVLGYPEEGGTRQAAPRKTDYILRV